METLAINPAQRMIIESFAATRDEEWHTWPDGIGRSEQRTPEDTL
jgi:hypothetical protein